MVYKNHMAGKMKPEIPYGKKLVDFACCINDIEKAWKSPPNTYLVRHEIPIYLVIQKKNEYVHSNESKQG